MSYHLNCWEPPIYSFCLTIYCNYRVMYNWQHSRQWVCHGSGFCTFFSECNAVFREPLPRLMGRAKWAQLLSLTPADFYMWDHPKSVFYTQGYKHADCAVECHWNSRDDNMQHTWCLSTDQAYFAQQGFVMHWLKCWSIVASFVNHY
jgi:hypothetical protein